MIMSGGFLQAKIDIEFAGTRPPREPGGTPAPGRNTFEPELLSFEQALLAPAAPFVRFGNGSGEYEDSRAILPYRRRLA